MRYNKLHNILERAGYELTSDGRMSGQYPYAFKYGHASKPDILVITGRTGHRQPGAVWRVFYGGIAVYWPREGIDKLDKLIAELEA